MGGGTSTLAQCPWSECERRPDCTPALLQATHSGEAATRKQPLPPSQACRCGREALCLGAIVGHQYITTTGSNLMFFHKSDKVLVTLLCPTLCNPMGYSPPGSSVCGAFQQEYWRGCPSLPQGIFLTQVLNPGLLHCRQILYCLSQQGSPFLFYICIQLAQHHYLTVASLQLLCSAALVIN